jgi:hypothetical protein
MVLRTDCTIANCRAMLDCLKRIDVLFNIERDINGGSADERG